MSPRVSVVIPVYNEGDHIIPVLDRLFEAITLHCEVLVVYDSLDDTTRPVLEEYAEKEPRLLPTLNTYEPGPAQAIRYGLDNAASPVLVVTMADGCDDAMQIDTLTRLVERGVVVAAASRYMRGGQQVGGPAFKSLPLPPGRQHVVLVRSGRYPRRDELVQGLLGGLRARRRTAE